MPVHNIQTQDQFHKTIAEHKTVLIDFYAVSCESSKTIAPIFVEQANRDDHQDVLFAKIDVDELKDLASKLGITSTPTLQLYKNGTKTGERVTPGPQALLQFVGEAM